MTKSKSTKRSLLSSALALLLCVSMLVGTTFAWFTDSVMSGKNVITSGNLDMELEYWNGSAWTTVDGATTLFSDEQWEPGHTQVVYLKLSNLGSLAAKYQLGIHIVSETSGTNKDDETFKLSDVIEFGVPEGAAEDDGSPVLYTSREKAVEAVTSAKKLSAGFADEGYFTDNSALYLNLVVYMPTTVDNKANYKTGTAAPTIDLGINLVATQYTYEEDSFDKLYDEGAEAVIVRDGVEYLYDGREVYLLEVTEDYDGDTLTVPEGVTAIANYAFSSNDSVKTVVLPSTVTDLGRGFDSSAVETVVLNEGLTAISSRAFRRTYELQEVVIPSTVTTVADNAFQSSGIAHITFPESVTSIGDSAFTASTVESVTIEGKDVYIAHYAFRDCPNLTSVTILSDTITLGDGMIFTNAQNNNADPNNITVYCVSQAVADTLNANADFKGTVVLLNDSTEVADGLHAYNGEHYVTSAAGLNNLNDALVNGEITAKGMALNLLSDMDMTGYTWTPVDSHADTKFYISEFNGNGHTISNLTVNGQAMFNRFSGVNDVVVKDLTFDNVTVNSSALNSAVLTVQTYQNTLLDNVDVKNSTISGSYKVAALIGSVYDENAASAKTLTVKNCDVDNCTIKSNLDFMACGMVAFVYTSDGDSVIFENSTISNTAIMVGSTGYGSVGYVYSIDGNAAGTFDSADGVTVTNCVKLSRDGSSGLYKDSEGNYYVYDAAGLRALRTWIGNNSNRSAFWGKTYNIMADIDATGVEWAGLWLQPDAGTFDGFTFNGNGHTISNLTVVPGTNGVSSLFAAATQGVDSAVPTTIKDITFDNMTVNGGANYHAGAVWGATYGDLTLDNVNVINSTVSGGCNVGGLVGRNDEGYHTITFRNCTVKDTTINATKRGDNAGASAFFGMALKIGTATNVNLVFDGTNVAEGNTLNTAAGMYGGGIYAKAEWGAATWDTPEVVNDFTNYNSN